MSDHFTKRSSTDQTTARTDRLRRISLAGLLFLTLPVGTGTAQQIGSTYCETGVESLIPIIYGMIVALAFPLFGYSLAKSGLQYMNAGANPERKNRAKESLTASGAGFLIVLVALVSPSLLDDIARQLGFAISDCVMPF